MQLNLATGQSIAENKVSYDISSPLLCCYEWSEPVAKCACQSGHLPCYPLYVTINVCVGDTVGCLMNLSVLLASHLFRVSLLASKASRTVRLGSLSAD